MPPAPGGRMFERFTDRARRVVVLAQEEARLLDHNYIGPSTSCWADPRGRRCRGDGAGGARRVPRAHPGPRRGDHRPRRAGAVRAHPLHAPGQDRARDVVAGGAPARAQLHRHRAHPARLDPRGRGRRRAGARRPGPRTRSGPPDGRPAAGGYAGSGEVPESVGSAVSVQVRQSMPGPGPISGFGTQFDRRRCSFCFQSEDRVTRLVRGRSAWICDECLAHASALVAEAGQEGPKQLRLRARFLPPAQTEDAEVAVEHAFETVFGGDTTVEERLALSRTRACCSRRRTAHGGRATGRRTRHLGRRRPLHLEEQGQGPLVADPRRWRPDADHGFAVLATAY